MTLYKKWQDMTEEEREVVKKEREEKLNQTQELLCKGIKAVIDSGQWQKFLQFSSKFWHYSFCNMMLVWMQRPDSTQIASIKTWNELGRFVKKGEKGMEILVPIFKKGIVDTADGKQIEQQFLVAFKIGHVFDVAQTDGKPIEDSTGVIKLQGDDQMMRVALMRYAIDVLGVKIVEEVMDPDCGGYISYDGEKPTIIHINAGNSPIMKAKTLAHEITHGKLHTAEEYRTHRKESIRELEAESSAFLVMNAFGIDSGQYSFMYLASWAGGEQGIKEIQESGHRIHGAACSIIEWIQEKYGIVQEQELIGEPA